ESEAETEEAVAIGVSDEGPARELGDIPGVSVEPDVKPTHMVDAGEATATVGQPGEGD
ncbi:MAG: hypothetical protein JOZ33_15400, partial [Acidobacteriaceae bacterium]|nr:hypothetical protein [Acidobacteriaceae bacterium]